MEKLKNLFTKLKEFVLSHKKICIISASAFVVIVAAVIVICVNVNKNKRSSAAVVENETETTVDKETTESPTEKVSEEETKAEKTNNKINPLTGEKTKKNYNKVRPYAIMLNTIQQALPQSGNSYADMYIEMTEEGGITRVLGIYTDISDISKLGSIRSTREYYLSWVMGLDAILVHAGGDSWVFGEIRKSGYTSLNCVGNAGYNASSAFYRDSYRQQNVGNEHSLYTTGPKLLEVVKNYEIDTNHTRKDYTKFTFADDGDGTPKKGTSAVDVKVTFSGYKSTSFKYNKKNKNYDVYFWDAPYIDEINGEAIAVKNVIILPVPNWTDVDAWGKTRQKYDMSGGTGYYISGGKCIEIKWTKGDYNKREEYGNSFNMTTMDGKPVEMGVGKTYICMMSNVFPPEIN